MELWFLLSVITVFFWGSAGVFAKVSTPKLGVARVALLITIVEGPMYLTAFLVWRENVDISVSDAALAVSSCIIGVLGYICFFESIMQGQVAIAGTISAAYPALTVIGALFLLSESLSAVQALGVAAIIGGVIALSYEPDPTSKHATNKRSMVFAFLAFALWGIWSLTSKMAIDRVGAGNLFVFYVVSSVTAPVIYASLRRDRQSKLFTGGPSRFYWTIGALALAVNVAGAFAYTFALEDGTASLVVPISSAYPLVTIVLAVALLHEKLTKLHYPALAAVVAGLVLIGVTL